MGYAALIIGMFTWVATLSMRLELGRWQRNSWSWFEEPSQLRAVDWRTSLASEVPVWLGAESLTWPPRLDHAAPGQHRSHWPQALCILITQVGRMPIDQGRCP